MPLNSSVTPLPEGIQEAEFVQILIELEENEGYKWLMAEITRRIESNYKKMRAPLVATGANGVASKEQKIDRHNSNVASCRAMKEVLKMVQDRKNRT